MLVTAYFATLPSDPYTPLLLYSLIANEPSFLHLPACLPSVHLLNILLSLPDLIVAACVVNCLLVSVATFLNITCDL